MADRCFLDTNLLVYAVDESEPDKRERAIELIQRHARARSGVISTQVLQEFFSCATTKLGIPPLEAKQQIQDFLVFDVVQVTTGLMLDGIDFSILNGLSFWDGLIVAAGTAAGCAELLTEHLSNGQVFRGLTVRNPFV